MSTKMFILRASCLTSCPKLTLALNSRTMSKENNLSFELKHGLGNLRLKETSNPHMEEDTTQTHPGAELKAHHTQWGHQGRE